MSIKHRAAAIGKTVAALVIIGAVAASCSSGGDDAAAESAGSSNAGPTSAAPTSAPADAPVGAPTSPEDQAGIIAITKTYVTGLNNGDAKMLEHAMCQATLAKYNDLSVGARPSPTPQQVNGITDITVAGDLGFGTVEYSLVNDPSAAGMTIPLAYKNEGGWKVCDEA